MRREFEQVLKLVVERGYLLTWNASGGSRIYVV